MFRKIRERLFGVSPRKSRSKESGGSLRRRLNFENLESRNLLTASWGVLNGSFEAPALAAHAFQYSPTGGSWVFGPGTGETTNGSSFTLHNPGAPDGGQVGFIQGGGSLSQSIYLDAGTYNLSLAATQRAYDPSSQVIQVLIDGNSVGTITPNSTAYSTYQSQNFFVATTGTHTVQFVGLNPQGGDNTAFIDEVAIAPVVDSISDGSFEAPAMAAQRSYQYGPDGSPWQFVGAAGVSNNGSGFTNDNWVAPAGNQVAFIQAAGSMSQSVYLDAGTYGLSFLAAQRANQPSSQVLEVLVDGNSVGSITPVGTTTYDSFQTSNFTVAAGTHTIEFLGLNPSGGDNTAFVDAVTLTTANYISDGTFQSPVLAANTYQYAPTGTAWQFVGGTGVSFNGSAFTQGNSKAPDGQTQVGFIQDYGSMSQTVTMSAGIYNLSFMAAQRAAQIHYQAIEVLMDGTPLTTIIPTRISYGLYQTSNFTIAAGTHTFQLVGLDPQGGDNTAFIDEVAVTEVTAISDSSFEAPALAAQTFQYAPTGSSWLFTGGAGVSGNGSAFTNNNPGAPDGSQVAFIQKTGSINQTIYMTAGSYTLGFLAAQRSGQTQYQQIEVLVDGVSVGAVIPNSNGYATYQTSNFTVAAGTHSIQFIGLNPTGGDNTAFIDEVTVVPAVDPISDGSFEAPGLAATTYQYTPSGSPWAFNGTSGITSNNSAFTSSTANAPDGSQVAFVQQGGSISQSVYLNAGTYSLSFMAAQRGGQAHYQEIEVLVDGASVGTFIPNSNSYSLFATSSFTVTAGTHTVEFLGLNPVGGDNTAFIDEVQF
jgi:hypothetical protein